MIGRITALAALVVVVVVVAVVLLGSGGGDYRIHAHFVSAAQLVKGDTVNVSGRPVGSVQSIDLTDDGLADVQLKITDGEYAPLRVGTQAVIRQASLSGVANRYVDLQLPPGTQQRTLADGAVLPTSSTSTAVDLDQLFDTFNPKSRRALQGLIRGFAKAYGGSEKDAAAGYLYLDPSLAASSRLFEEVDHDTPLLRRFIDASSNLVTDVAGRRDDLAGLVRNLSTTTGAIADRDRSLDAALVTLPRFMRRANTTFVNLRATLSDLRPLVDESKPVARKLQPLLAQLRPLARDASPTLNDLSAITGMPGPANDLVDLTRSAVAVDQVATRDNVIDGKARDGALPATVKALGQATPELTFARPYSVDLTGWFDDFGHSGIIDALGGASRVAPHVNAFGSVNGVLAPLLGPVIQQANLAGNMSLNQRNRCPESMERGSAWKPTPTYDCDLTQQPLGP